MAAPAILDQLATLDRADAPEFLADLEASNPAALDSLVAQLFDWEGSLARDEQKEPTGDWRVWLINAGRGYGKTRSGGEWVRKGVENGRYKRIALVGRTAADVRDVMIEGESGLLSICPPWNRPTYYPSKRLVRWPNGAEAHCYSADKPDQLRGPQHDAAWSDELASWKYKDAWDQLMFGLRLGVDPRVCVTTTPKPTLLMKQLMERKSTRVTGGSTYDNLANLAPAFIEEIIQLYEGTALGEQELYAKLLMEAKGALWKRAWIEANRLMERDADGHVIHPDLDMLLVAVDPAVTSHEDSDETGILVVGRAFLEGIAHFYVLDDLSGRLTPNEWGTTAIEAYEEYEADGILAEVNNGGDLVKTIIHSIDPDVPYRDVRASRGKEPRAQPVAAMYQQNRVHHCGVFRDYEDQLCQWEPGEGGKSPDRLDAGVWGVAKLTPRRKPRTKRLDMSGLGRESVWLGDQE